MGLVKGLPVGLSFIGPKWSDALMLSLGYSYEQARGAVPGPTFIPAIEMSRQIAPHLEPAVRP
jgi:amidase